MPWNPLPRAVICPRCWWLSFSGQRLVVLLNYRSGLEVDQRADRYQHEGVSDFQLWSRVALTVPSSATWQNYGQAPSSSPCSGGISPWCKAGAEDSCVGRYQGLKESCFPSLLEQFPATHRCNHYCSMLGLKMLEPAKPKGSKSPCLGRKSAQSSPQLQKKVLTSPQGTRKASVSPKSSRRAAETGEAPTACKPRSGESNRTGCPQ